MKHCSSCGKIIQPEDTFCSYCGQQQPVVAHKTGVSALVLVLVFVGVMLVGGGGILFAMALSSSETGTRDATATEEQTATTPQNAAVADAPTNASEPSPADVPESPPTDAPEPSPTDAPEPLPTDGPDLEATLAALEKDALQATITALEAENSAAEAARVAEPPGVNRPPIQGRSSWGAVEPISAMTSQTPDRIMLSHEAESCCDGVDPRDRIYSIQQAHMNRNNWNDISFHYIIAPDGTIYEGRNPGFQVESGFSGPPHYQNVNGMIAIGVLGNYDIQQPTTASLRSIEQLMAWLCQEYDISPQEIHQWRDMTTSSSPGASMPGSTTFRQNVSNLLQGNW
ncbi:MAG: zinc-ribbon domain-containing protein [Chloroflexaceae bacterium]|nr:zinc-ribbon domain-containing protein [Chloroflexaceae bacterium]